MIRDDGRLTEAKAIPMQEVALRLGLENLRPAGGELVGPCPNCGGDDRFGINLHTNVFGCRKGCGPHCKGDQVALVQHVLGVEFRAALEWLVGPSQELTGAQIEERRRKAAKAKAKQDRIAAEKRADAIASARRIWQAAAPAEGTMVRAYLERRGIPRNLMPNMPAALRYSARERYTVPVAGQPGRWDVLFEGPCMIAAIVDGGNAVTAVHRTWIDLDQPSGKRLIQDPAKEGETLPAKKVLGSKRGGVIRLRPPAREDACTLVMGEGIETTATGMISAADDGGAAYWAGVDLGNMAGRQKRIPGRRHSGIPDMADRDAFVPPPWVRRLIFIQDGDSDPVSTRAKLLSGIRRAMAHRPGLEGFIVHPGAGMDLNDLLRRGAPGQAHETESKGSSDDG